jgi:hypothetical protein
MALVVCGFQLKLGRKRIRSANPTTIPNLAKKIGKRKTPPKAGFLSF